MMMIEANGINMKLALFIAMLAIASTANAQYYSAPEPDARVITSVGKKTATAYESEVVSVTQISTAPLAQEVILRKQGTRELIVVNAFVADLAPGARVLVFEDLAGGVRIVRTGVRAASGS